jgi:3-hydroxyisobutyrate dehydrogenase-like beta-hydroxyacid dehydrogenase
VRVGFIGLGAMGSGIVRRLIAAGHDVTGWNRTAEKAAPLVAEGMRLAQTARDAAAAGEVAITMLTDVRALEAVADEVAAGLGRNAVWLDMSTIAPDESRALAARVPAFLDAPVSGSLTTLAAGQLSIMVAGDRAHFDRVEPLLLDIGPKVTYLGAQGNALLMKMAINLSLVVQGMSFCESLAMAENAGIPREAAVDAVLKSVIASPMLQYRAPMILEGGMPETPFANAALQQKDQQLGLKLGRDLGTPLPFASLANEMLTLVRAAGLGEQEWIAVYEVFRRLGGGVEAVPHDD